MTTEHAQIMAMIDQVFNDMRHRNEVSINPVAVGDKVAALLDPARRAPALAYYTSSMKCRDYARERVRQRVAELHALSQGEFELEPYCPTGRGDEYVLREEMTLDERTAFSESLGREIGTKTVHKMAFDEETNDLIAAGHFDERGRPRHTRRVFDDQDPTA
ncbi:hypothetical protein [Paraburkholderia adhaesiva]|uniref:hypothetical protein n=1 Tax=Paraburkholderia adhaesiva TaxID=2883244 RepID=UPI001F2719DF|nr:hypothetical protein [Paraburkholderia adhaesiva]